MDTAGHVVDGEEEDDELTPCMAWFVARRDVIRQLRLVFWKSMKLREGSPVGTLLELLLPLVAFVALAVLCPRNEYFDSGYIPGDKVSVGRCTSKLSSLERPKILSSKNKALSPPFPMKTENASLTAFASQPGCPEVTLLHFPLVKAKTLPGILSTLLFKIRLERVSPPPPACHFTLGMCNRL